MASIIFNRMSEKMAEMAAAGRPDYYVRVKRRTWRTLWLVKRTYREPRWNPINIQLMTMPLPPRPKVDKPPATEIRG